MPHPSSSAPADREPVPVPVPVPVSGAAPIDPLDLYGAGIDSSDYVAKVAPLIRARLPATGDLLDVGAGAGQLGRALAMPGQAWTAIEPSPAMRARLARLDAPAPVPTRVLPQGWEATTLPAGGHDTVLAANIAAPLTVPAAFLRQCRSWARRAVVWVVPAQAGPRGLCLAGCLPAAWHGEDETPGVEIVLAGLGADRPDGPIPTVDWTFSACIPDLPRLATYLADRLAWPAADPRRPDLLGHLEACAVPLASGFRLDVPRKSAILVWRLP